MKNLVNSFRDYARLPLPQLAPVDLNCLLREILVLYEGTTMSIKQECATDLPLVQADASQLRQVIHNLLQNAQDAVSEREDATISIATRFDGKRAELYVRDNGAGFSPFRAGTSHRALRHHQATWVRPGAGHRPQDHRRTSRRHHDRQPSGRWRGDPHPPAPCAKRASRTLGCICANSSLKCN